MKRSAYLLVVVLLAAFFFIFSRPSTISDGLLVTDTPGQLQIPQRNVVIATVDLPKSALDLDTAAHVAPLRELQAAFQELPGVSRVDSILSVSRVIAVDEDIIVSRAVPADQSLLTDQYMVQLLSEWRDYPEIWPYVSEDARYLLFYVYYGNKVSPQQIYRSIEALQSDWNQRLPFDFTGQRPIIAETEQRLTGDIGLFFPILGILIILVFGLFRSKRVLAAAIVLMLVSVATAYGLVRFIGIADSPLLLLVPVFGFGLLSDYALHYFYHFFHAPETSKTHGLRKSLLFPLSLTALSTFIGFLSLSLINGSGHLQLGLLIASAVLITYGGVFLWLDYQSWPPTRGPLMQGFQRFQGRLFARIAQVRYFVFALVLLVTIAGALQIPNLTIEPYPIGQLPDSSTIRKADDLINRNFFGSVPFFIEIDTGKSGGLLQKENLLALEMLHRNFDAEEQGYAYSLLTVLKRMNYYFMGSEDSLLETDEFDDYYDMLVEQYLLYYSSSVDPAEFAAMVDNSYRFVSFRGFIHYHDFSDIQRFQSLLAETSAGFPAGWQIISHGMLDQLSREHRNLGQNWVFSFLGGGLLIFLTVWAFYRKLKLALLSLIPGIISMIISFGVIALLGISVDAFSIIFVSIITGLVIDYSIHTLAALDTIGPFDTLEAGFLAVLGYSGIPIFLSFVTSFGAFSVLFISSFSGARNLGFLLCTSLVLSFFLSLYLLPLIMLPYKMNKEKSDA